MAKKKFWTKVIGAVVTIGGLALANYVSGWLGYPVALTGLLILALS